MINRGWILIATLVACGDDGPHQTLLPPLDVPPSIGCSPLLQTGCGVDEKCTWISDQVDPPIGHVGCTADGALAVGDACTEPDLAAGDACRKGSVCLGGECKQICDNDGGAPTCDENHSCQIYADFFERSGTTIAGVCDPACDPLTQDLKTGAARDACGSPSPLAPAKGCYGYSEYACAPAGASSWTRTDRQPPRTNPAGNPYLNGCAPGWIPLYYDTTGSTTTLCTGLCAALEIDNTTAHAGNQLGNAAALGKLPTSAKAVGDATCAGDKKGSEASSECRFLWPALVDRTTGELPLAFAQGPYRDTLGACMATLHYRYDADGDTMLDTVFPPCATLPPRSPATSGPERAHLFDDAADFGCQLVANSPAAFTGRGSAPLGPALQDLRVPADGALLLVRHGLR